MKDTADGYAVVEVGGRSYDVAPTFSNIAKIGNPKKIIDDFKLIGMRKAYPVAAFSAAVNVLDCCGLPVELTGGLVFNEWQGYSCILPGELPPVDVYTLAMHCLKHGISGSREQLENASRNSNGSGSREKMAEFDPYQYIMSGVDFLGLSISEAKNLTMTEYLRLANAKMKLVVRNEESEAPTQQQSEDAFERYQRLLKEREEKQ